MEAGFGRGSRERRALNIVWTAAGSYGFMPDFLAFHRDGSPDVYLNSIIGFAWRLYDADMLAEYVRGLDRSLLRDTFTDILWLGLESAVYARMLPERPVLAELRTAHARQFLEDEIDLSMQQLMMRSELIHTLKAGRCREILGEKTGIRNPWERRLYQALDYGAIGPECSLVDSPATAGAGRKADDLAAKDAATAEIIRRTDDIIARFFVVRLNDSLRGALHISLGTRLNAWLRRLLPMERRQVDDIRRLTKPVVALGEQASGAVTDTISFAGGREGSRVLAELRAEFGEPLWGEEKRLQIEQQYCTENHQAAHLYLARGRATAAIRSGNRAFYEAQAARYRITIRRLAARLRSALAVYRQPVPVRAKSGDFCPGLVWQALTVHDTRVFTESSEEVRADFAVTLLLDASESRAGQVPLIASQAYAIARALTLAGIAVQVVSFCSLKGYTVFRELKSFAESRADGAFDYQTAGWNRDGLALRAVRALLPSGQRNVVLVLTDAHPSDDLDLPLVGSAIGRHYMGRPAVEDAAAGSRELRASGVRLVGLINSVVREAADTAAREIYGASCARIEQIDDLARVVAVQLERQIGRAD